MTDKKADQSALLQTALVKDLIKRISKGDTVIQGEGDDAVTLQVRCAPAVLTAAIAYLKTFPPESELPVSDGLGQALSSYVDDMKFGAGASH